MAIDHDVDVRTDRLPQTLGNIKTFHVSRFAIQQFQKRYQLPGIFRVIDWHRAVREFFRTEPKGGKMDTNFVHADESETSLGLLLHPDMVDMDYAVDTEGKGYLPDGHFDKSVDPFGRPSRWSEGEGHFAIEIAATPEGVVGKATQGTAYKAKRPMAAILKYLTLLNDQIPLSIGGGIGQSRTYMYLLRTAHLGEVSVTVWPKILKDICAQKNINVLE